MDLIDNKVKMIMLMSLMIMSCKSNDNRCVNLDSAISIKDIQISKLFNAENKWEMPFRIPDENLKSKTNICGLNYSLFKIIHDGSFSIEVWKGKSKKEYLLIIREYNHEKVILFDGYSKIEFQGASYRKGITSVFYINNNELNIISYSLLDHNCNINSYEYWSW